MKRVLDARGISVEPRRVVMRDGNEWRAVALMREFPMHLVQSADHFRCGKGGCVYYGAARIDQLCCRVMMWRELVCAAQMLLHRVVRGGSVL